MESLGSGAGFALKHLYAGSVLRIVSNNSELWAILFGTSC